VWLPLALPDSTNREMEQEYAVPLYAKQIPNNNNVQVEVVKQPY